MAVLGVGPLCRGCALGQRCGGSPLCSFLGLRHDLQPVSGYTLPLEDTASYREGTVIGVYQMSTKFGAVHDGGNVSR
jgi:hypothetical protein